MKIFVSNIDEAIGYTATYVVVNAMLQNYLFGKVRWPWMSELYEYLQGVYLFGQAIVSVVRNPAQADLQRHGQGPDAEHRPPLGDEPPVLRHLWLAARWAG